MDKVSSSNDETRSADGFASIGDRAHLHARRVAAYDARAFGTSLAECSADQRPLELRRTAEAISFAAFAHLPDLFPQDENTVFHPVMQRRDMTRTTGQLVPKRRGNMACAAVLSYGHTTARINSGISRSITRNTMSVIRLSNSPVDTYTILDPNPLQIGGSGRRIVGTAVTREGLAQSGRAVVWLA